MPLEIKEHLAKYVKLDETGDKVSKFVDPYNGKEFDNAGAMNFDMFNNYGADKKLPQVDIIYLSNLPKVPRHIEAKDTLR